MSKARPLRALLAAELLLGLSLLLAACQTSLPPLPVAFDTAGGDAWTFEKMIAGSADPACDSVLLQSPRNTVTVTPSEGRFNATLPLVPGDNIVEAICQKAGAAYGDAARQRWVVRLADRPKATAQIQIAAAGLVLDAGASEPAPVRAAPLTAFEWRARPGNPALLAGLPAYGRRIVLPVPAKDGAYYLELRATDALGRIDASGVLFRMHDGKPEIVHPTRAHAAWIGDTVLYGVAPFFYGGGRLDDVAARLDHLARLGAETILLSPLTQSAEDDFGYAVTDHFRLRPRFGSTADFRALIAAIRARNMRVIMDFVPNHLADRHPYFIDAERHGSASPYFDFFVRGPDGAAVHYFDWRNLKNLNYDHPEVRRMIVEAAAYWLRNYDIDGFRIDAIWGPRRRAPDFWPQWSREMRRIKPDLLLLAEASARDPYYFRHGFDAAYDWTDQLGEWAWRAAFEDEARTASHLRRAIGTTAVPPESLVFRFIDNNDTGARFIARYGLPRSRVAAAMLLTLPGLPGLYAGQEVGAAFLPYDEEPIERQGDHDLRNWYRHLLDLRRRHEALRGADLQFVETGSPHQVLAYLRPAARPRDAILVLLNYGPATQNLVVPTTILKRMQAGTTLVDLLNEEEIALQNGRALALPGHGARILQAR